ncbi:MAG: 30S ribosomal protein S7 [Candidatus Cloacimonadota bacterium]|nr:MAG: 30S ribosomal protein S7 [Candidatus Cloacimonadota bacterium]
MPRRRRPERRTIAPDPRHNSLLVAGLINNMMKSGKKSISEKIVEGAIEIIGDKTGKNGVGILEKAIQNVLPKVEVRPRRVGGATYQVPMEVRQDRRTTLAIRWIVTAARSRSGHSMKEKLAMELVDASNNQGVAIKRKEDTHKMAEANKAFAHFRW